MAKRGKMLIGLLSVLALAVTSIVIYLWRDGEKSRTPEFSKPVRVSDAEMRLRARKGMVWLELPHRQGDNSILFFSFATPGAVPDVQAMPDGRPHSYQSLNGWTAFPVDRIAVYFDTSPEDKKFLYTLHYMLGRSSGSCSPWRQGNENIEDYAVDPSPAALSKDGVSRCFMKYTKVPGQKVDPDMSKILPGEVGFGFRTEASAGHRSE